MKPRRFLFISHDGGGTVPPMIALAQCLVRRGHDVAVVGQPSIAARAVDAGCRFVEMEGIGDYDVGKTIEEQPQLALNVIAGELPGAALRSTAETEHSDVVIVDCISAGAAAAAEALGRPSVVLFHRLYQSFFDPWFADFWPVFEGMINGVRSGYGLDPVTSWADVFSRHDRLYSVVPRHFDAMDAPPEAMRYFGFLIPDGGAPETAASLPAGDSPTVLVSLSSTYQHQEGLLQTIVDALGQLPVRALVTTGTHVDPASVDASAHVVVKEFVAHRAVLPQIDVAVTHGGLGTVAAALNLGVPLVIAPIGRDQPLNAQRVAALGAGVDLGGEPSADDVRDAINEVVHDRRYREGATEVARASHAAGGVDAAASDLEGLLE